MLHDFLFAPFSDPATQQLYEQLRALLRADTKAPVSLLLGNFAVEEGGETLDAVLVRPHSITVLVLVPHGGTLQVPALHYGTWQLDGQPLPGTGEADNPYEQFTRQKAALAAWLGPQFGPPEQANMQFISGLVVFGAPVTFGPEVKDQLGQHPDGSFQLLADAAQLPQRLAQLARPEIALSETQLTQWAQVLAEEPEPEEMTNPKTASATPDATPTRSFWGRAWSWLGADDIPEDTPYGHTASQAAASTAEKQRLEQLQREAQAQVQQQLRAMEAREAERERRIEELRTQLAQAPSVTSEAQQLQDRLAAESQEKASLEAAIRASRADSDARNRELDTKINQLGQLIEQLNTRTAAPPASGAAAASAAPPTVGPAKPSPLAFAGRYRQLRNWRRRLPRVAAVAGVAGLLGLGAWGISRLTAGPPKPYQENGKWGLANASGEPVVPARYSAVGPVLEERAVVEENGVFGVIDASGKELVPPAYDALNPYAEGYARVRIGDAYTFLDEEGQEFPNYYFNALDFAEGYAAVLDNRGWHYITGPEPEDPAQPPVLFREAYSFRDGLARVRLADGYSYIKKAYLSTPEDGTVPFGRYELATDFEQGKARVTQNGQSFLIDTDGERVE